MVVLNGATTEGRSIVINETRFCSAPSALLYPSALIALLTLVEALESRDWRTCYQSVRTEASHRETNPRGKGGRGEVRGPATSARWREACRASTFSALPAGREARLESAL